MATGTLTMIEFRSRHEAVTQCLEALALLGFDDPEIRAGRTGTVPGSWVTSSRVVVGQVEDVVSSIPIDELLLDDDLLDLQLDGRAAKYQANLRAATTHDQREYWTARLRKELGNAQ